MKCRFYFTRLIARSFERASGGGFLDSASEEDSKREGEREEGDRRGFEERKTEEERKEDPHSVAGGRNEDSVAGERNILCGFVCKQVGLSLI